MDVKITQMRLGKDGRLYVGITHDRAESTVFLRFPREYEEYIKSEWDKQPFEPALYNSNRPRKRKYDGQQKR